MNLDRIPLSDEESDYDGDLDFDFDDTEDSDGDYEELDFDMEDSPLYDPYVELELEDYEGDDE